MLNRPVPKSSKLGILGLFVIVVIGAILLPMGCNPAGQTALETPVKDGRIVDKIIVPGLRVGDYTFDMSKDDVLESLRKPKMIFYGTESYTLDNLPRTYYMSFDDVSFHILDDSVKGITAISPFYKFANGLGVGDSEGKIKQAFGNDFHLKETEWKDFLTYEDEGLVFEINKNDRTVMEINVLPVSLKSYKKADIPPSSTIDEDGRIVDKIDYSFVDDPEAIGGWKAIDFIKDIEDFKPGQKNWKGDLFLKELFILDGSKTNWAFTWTKGLILHHGDKTASKYFIKEIDGVKFMFFEWKSGDYTIRHRKPCYYVLQKDEDMVYIESRTVDKIDYPFVDDKRVIGTWKSVDFVSEMEQFKAGKKQWMGRGGKLFLNDMIFEENGRLTCKNDKVPNGYSRTWTKGLVIYNNDTKTASKYTLKDMDGSTYMFYEWKSGDYTIRHRKPKYYVLKKISSETGGLTEVGVSQPSDAEFARQKAELAKQKAELEKARAEIEKDKAEIEKAMAEIERAKAEIEKAKTEAEKAKAETERVKSEANRQAREIERSKK